MHHEIRVPADGRGEVEVGGRGQAEVADVVGAVLRLHHRAQEQRIERLLLRLSLQPLEQFVQLGRSGVDRDRESVQAGELRERLQLLLVGLVVDAVHGGQPAHFEEARHRLVRRQHELLDQPVRVVARPAHDLRHRALVAEHDLRLGQIEVDRAALAPLRSELPG